MEIIRVRLGTDFEQSLLFQQWPRYDLEAFFAMADPKELKGFMAGGGDGAMVGSLEMDTITSSCALLPVLYVMHTRDNSMLNQGSNFSPGWPQQ